MSYDIEKIDEYAIALLYLGMHGREEGFGARAWKSFDWEAMNRLHEKGMMANPATKAKSVMMTEEGYKQAKALFEKHFLKS